MSIDAMSWAFKQRGMKPSQKLVLLCLADRTGSENGICWPGTREIAERTGLSRDTVSRMIAWLSDKGFVEVTERARENGSQTTHQYALNSPEAIEVRENSKKSTGAANSDGGGRTVRPPEPAIKPVKIKDIVEEEASSTIPYEEIAKLYNTTLTSLAKVRDVTEKRKALIRKAWKESPTRQRLEFWAAHFEECADDDFLNGTGPYKNGHEKWRPTFDYLIRSDVVQKLYERALSPEASA